MTSAHPLHTTRGFTLLEVLVSLSILAIALVAVIKSAIQVQETLLRSKKQCLVGELATNRLARVKAQGLDNIIVWDGEFEDHPNYRWRLDIQPTSMEGLVNLRVVISTSDNPAGQTVFQEYIYQAQE